MATGKLLCSTGSSADSPTHKLYLRAPVFLPGEFHGQRSLAGYSPRGHKESDTTDRISAEDEADGITDSTDMNVSKLWDIVEDRRAWQATAHGVTKSRTRLSKMRPLPATASQGKSPVPP